MAIWTEIPQVATFPEYGDKDIGNIISDSTITKQTNKTFEEKAFLHLSMVTP